MIEVVNVWKSYRSGTRCVEALRGIDCRIERGRFAFIVGPSGSGKSTLLYLLGALDRPSDGEILVNGQSLVTMSEAMQNLYRREQVGFIFQSFNLISNLSALENVLVPFLPRGITADQRVRAGELLKQVGLENRIDHKPYQLSGGEQQRVAIARALIKRPLLVLADEPTGELDSKSGDEIYKILRSMQHTYQTTLVVVTHDRRFITPDDLVLEIQDGQVAPESESIAGASSSPNGFESRGLGGIRWRRLPWTRSEPQSRRMTLPKVWFAASRAWPSRTSSHGKTASTTGRTTPLSSQGTTCLANKQVAAILSSSGRARNVVPTTVSRLLKSSPRSRGASRPPSSPTRTSRP